MIITVRSQFKKTTFRYAALFVVIVIGLSVISIPMLMRQQGSSWSMKINGEKISYKDFAQEVAEQSDFLTQVRAQYGQYAELLFQAMGWPTDPKFLAYETLIKSTLMSQLVKKLGIHIDNAYIAESINNAEFARKNLQRVLPPFVFNQNGTIDIEKLAMYLQHKGISHKDFEHKIEQNLAQLQAIQFISSTCYIPSFDSTQELIAHKFGKQFSYLTFSFDAFLSAQKNQEITDEQGLAFYEKENSKSRRYYVPEKRDGILYTFTASDYNADISQAQINEYYEDNKVSKYILDPIKVQVQKLTEKQLPEGVSLEDVYTKLTNNPTASTEYTWQLLEPFARTEKKEKYVQESFLLQNAGDISSIVEIDGEKAIVQLVKRIPRTYKPIETVRNEIKNNLMEKQFKKNFVKDLKDIATKGETAIQDFIAKKVGKRELVTGIEKNDSRLSQELFDLKKGEYGFYIDNNKGCAVVLTSIIGRHLPSYDSIKDIVKNDMREEQAHDAMKNAVEQARKEAKTASLQEIAKKYNVSIGHTDMIFPDDAQKIKELDKKGLPTRIMLGIEKKNLPFVFYGDQSTFLIKIDTLQKYNQEKSKDIEKEEKNTLNSYRLKGHLESAVASLHRNATIETNESITIVNEEYSE